MPSHADLYRIKGEEKALPKYQADDHGEARDAHTLGRDTNLDLRASRRVRRAMPPSWSAFSGTATSSVCQ